MTGLLPLFLALPGFAQEPVPPPDTAERLQALGYAQPQEPAQEPPIQEQPVQPEDEESKARLLGPGRGLEITLEGAYRIALRRNPSLAIRATQAEVARLRGAGSWGAFDWVVNSRLGYSDAELPAADVFQATRDKNADFQIDFTKPLQTGGRLVFSGDAFYRDTDSGQQTEPTSYTDVIAVSYFQPLLRGAWSDYATADQRLAELEAQRTEQVMLTAQNRLLVDVANAYWDLVSAREQLDVAEKSLDLSRAQVDQNQRRLDAGLGTEVEVVQARADEATREEQRLLREFELRAATDVLRRLLFPGTDEALWDTALVPATPLPEDAVADGVPSWGAAMRVAIDRRPELEEQRKRIDEAELRHGVSRGDTRPRLDLDLSAGAQGFDTEANEALSSAASWEFPTYRAALLFEYAIGNTTARYAERAAWAEIRAARLEYDDLETSIVAEVRGAVRDVVYSVEAVRASRKSLEYAERQLAAEQARYAVDQSTNFQVLQYQTDLATALSNERRARVAYAKSLVRLSAAQGAIADGIAQ